MVIKKTNKKSSTIRLLQLYKGIPIEDISLIQSYYSQKKPEEIKRILERNGKKIKATTTPTTMMSYGRLASQYVALLDKPSKNDIGWIRKKYKVNIGIEFKQNLILLGNKEGKVEIIYDEPEIDTLKQFLYRITGLIPIKSGRKYTIIYSITNYENEKRFVIGLLQTIQMNTDRLEYDYGVYKLRLFIKMITDVGDQWISTPKLDVIYFNDMYKFLNNYQAVLTSNMVYVSYDEYDNEVSRQTIEYVEEIRIMFWF